MKRIFVLIMLFFGVSGLKAQTDVTINPVVLLFGYVGVGVEGPLSDNFGLEGTANFNFNKYNVLDSEFESNGLGLRVLGKYYFKPEKGIDKFHIGPYARVSYNSIDYTNDDVSNFRFAIGFYAGYKWVSKGNIVFEIGMGLGRAFINKYSSDDASFDADDWPGLDLDGTGKLAVGYRFYQDMNDD